MTDERLQEICNEVKDAGRVNDLVQELIGQAVVSFYDREQVTGPFYRRPFRLEKGQVLEGHRHNYDHVTVLVEGAVTMRATLHDGTDVEKTHRREVGGPLGTFVVEAGVEHEFTALTDVSAECWYVHRNWEGRITKKWTGNKEAYC